MTRLPDRNEGSDHAKKIITARDPVLVVALAASAQGFNAEPVFTRRAPPRPTTRWWRVRCCSSPPWSRWRPGWHINSDDPGDEFSMPTTVAWLVPEGWPEPLTVFPDGEQLEFDFSDVPIEVWEGKVVLVGRLTVPETAEGAVRPRVEVTAQACNNTQCLPPVAVKTGVDLEIVRPAAPSELVNQELFEIPSSVADPSRQHPMTMRPGWPGCRCRCC